MRLLFLFWDALGSPGSWNNYPLRTEEHKNARDTGSTDTFSYGVSLLLLSTKGLTAGKCLDSLHLSQTSISGWVLKATFFLPSLYFPWFSSTHGCNQSRGQQPTACSKQPSPPPSQEKLSQPNFSPRGCDSLNSRVLSPDRGSTALSLTVHRWHRKNCL